MRYYLAGLSGTHKGRLWPVGETGLLLGRDGSCDISLMDPVVSRHQCRVLARGGALFLEDSGGRNPTLVNGAAVKDATLRSGDMIALGRNVFLVSDDGFAAELRTDETQLDATAAWDKDSPILLNIEDARQQVDLRPSSLSDLVYLYDLTRDLNRRSTRNDFLDALAQQLRDRFHPRASQIVFPNGEEEGAAMLGDVRAPGKDIALECMEARHGILRPGAFKKDGNKQRLFTMAAPLLVGDRCLGALVLQTHTPIGVFDEDDLKLLVLLAGSAAPVLYTVEHSEQLVQDNTRLRALMGESDTLIGPSRKMGHVRQQLRDAAKTNLNVLITGETGTGKELAARAIYAQSAQYNKPFVVMNCAAIPRELFESELFGYRKGAFTGAVDNKPGLLSQANGGILFLDEVGDLCLDNQARILRVVEQGAFRHVGGEDEIHVSIRVIAATNKNLEAAIANGTFRADLLHRLNGYHIEMPPLREHAGDMPALVLHFLELARSQMKHPVAGLSPEAIELLQNRSWPGNVRELRNCVLRAVAQSKGTILQARDFPDQTVLTDHVLYDGDELVLLGDVEKRHIKAVINRCHGNLKVAAETLGIARSTLYKKISEYSIE